MFTIVRAVASRVPLVIPRQATRSFAEVVGASTASSSHSSGASTPEPKLARKSSSTLEAKIPVREDHGLYSFFRPKETKDGEVLVGDAKYDVVESPESMQKQTGRSWKASELRLKSFRDLHTLWYILLRERNLLATQKEEARRMGVTSTEMQVSARRVYHCRKSMARIKAVINERRLAYEGAVKIAEAQRDEAFNTEVQNYMQRVSQEERKYIQRRRERKERMLEKRRQADAINSTTQLSAADAIQTSSPAP
ncbi:hypothetical protein H0H81_005695 [Sphagnurus paluster]|uniref:Large ribosomal subunit protein uL29m n=1 Tax=Sphagnurus paluster TaxID=117069 RepID=A0A9P7FXU1_9AGAR|nr:hypothetical protein H0H81_005695 [Sphagnurus paluster]